MKLNSRQLQTISEALYLRHAMACNAPLITPMVKETMDLMKVIAGEIKIAQASEEMEAKKEEKLDATDRT